MPIVSTGALIDCLREHRLLPAPQLAELPHIAIGRCGEAKALARLLIQRGWLTVYQTNEVLAGRGRQLAFGPYIVLDRLGQGGLSQVFLARHSSTEQIVALKVIKPEVISSWRGRHQFLLEMEAMARLEHPNIVQCLDADVIDESCYFAMEYITGTDLGKHVRLTGALPVAEACDFIRQVALGLQHAHERNLVHRDIKPVNLFLMHEPLTPAAPTDRYAAFAANKPAAPTRAVVKILDWGLATLRAPQTVSPHVEDVSRGIIGTADYISPEQARDANTVDIRGDIYSLGCTLYYLLTGQPPFPHGTLMQKILQHQQADPTPLSAFRNDVPNGVTSILFRMLAKRPMDRFQTPAALALALHPYLHGEAVEALPVPAPPREPLQRRRDDTPLPIALGGELADRLRRTQKIPRLPSAGDTCVPHVMGPPGPARAVSIDRQG